MEDRLNDISRLVKENPIEFTRFSKDIQQINPQLRITSISNILNNLSLPRNSTILDIGTGHGYGSVLLNAMGYNVIGIERNKSKLQEGMNYWDRLGIPFKQVTDVPSAIKTSGELYFLQRDARDLRDFPDNSIDMATAFYISGYMAGEKGVFHDIGRILKPQKKLVLTTEGPTELPFFLRELAVRIAGKIFKQKNLKHISTQILENPKIYDKYILTFNKIAS